MNGFPNSLEELAPFRVLILSNLRPSDLTPAQQEILARFCGEMGGGLLLIGGQATFDVSWQSSRLEQLLPVVFAANTGLVVASSANGFCIICLRSSVPVSRHNSVRL